MFTIAGILALGQALLFSCGCLAVGLKLLKRLGLRQDSALCFPAGLLLGFSLAAYLVLAVGQSGFLVKPALWAVWILFVLFGILSFRRRPESRPFLNLDPGFRRGDVWVLGLATLLLIIGAFKPEVFFDSWVYHLALPQIFLQEGNTWPLERHFFSAMPMLKEMVSTLGLGLGGEPMAKLLVLFWSLAGPLMLWRWEKRLYAAVLFISTPIIFTALRRGVAEPISAAFLIAALYACLHPEDFKNKNFWAAVSGLLAGLFFSMKYFNVLWALPVFILFAWKARSTSVTPARLGGLTPAGSQTRRGEVQALFFFLAALLPILPWMARDFAAFGDPFYPVLSGYLGRLPSPEGWKIFVEESPHFYPGPRIYSDLMALWRGSFDAGDWAFFIGPAYLLLLPFVFTLRHTGESRYPGLGIFLIFAWILGLSRTHHLRYLSPLLAPLALLISKRAWTPAYAGVTRIIFLLCLGLHTFWMVRPWADPIEWKGLAAPREYLSLRYGYFWDAIDWVNAQTAPDSRVLLLGETRSYGFKRKLIVSTVHDRHPLMDWVEESLSVEQLKARFREAGVTHVFYHPSEAQRLSGYGSFYFSEKGQKLWEGFGKRYLKPIYSNEGVVIFSVIPA